MACEGQASTQAAQSEHSSSFTTALFSTMEMASVGQELMHSPLALHLFGSTIAGIELSPSLFILIDDVDRSPYCGRIPSQESRHD
jgi:hypothetical protein